MGLCFIQFSFIWCCFPGPRFSWYQVPYGGFIPLSISPFLDISLFIQISTKNSTYENSQIKIFNTFWIHSQKSFCPPLVMPMVTLIKIRVKFFIDNLKTSPSSKFNFAKGDVFVFLKCSMICTLGLNFRWNWQLFVRIFWRSAPPKGGRCRPLTVHHYTKDHLCSIIPWPIRREEYDTLQMVLGAPQSTVV